MTSSLIALLATTVQALPAEAVDAVAQAGAAHAKDFSLWETALAATIPVKIVMILLIVGSALSWFIIYRKWRVIARAKREADQFEERFWSGAELSKLYAGTTERARNIGGLEAIFESGFREFNRVRQRRGVDARAQIEGAQRAMRATGSRELDGLEHNLELLANIGSTSPYVGLVGTVFGIMVTMQTMASDSKQVSISVIAPHISEALLATAMGLFVAIPAVWAYNRFATSVERLAVRFDAFSEEFSSILQRQAHLDD